MPRASGTSGRRERRTAPLQVATLPADPADVDAQVGEERTSGERFLAAVMFTNFARSTHPFLRTDERRWPDLEAEARGIVGRQAARYDGTFGACQEGAFVRFSGAYSAVRCALAIKKELRGVGVDLRAGLHAGEGSVNGADITDVIAHVASRICDVAGSGRVLVSQPLASLVVESGLVFQDEGTYRLDGLLGEWHLLAVSD